MKQLLILVFILFPLCVFGQNNNGNAANTSLTYEEIEPNTTRILVGTKYKSEKEAVAEIVSIMKRHGIFPSMIDDKYFLITTEWLAVSESNKRAYRINISIFKEGNVIYASLSGRWKKKSSNTVGLLFFASSDTDENMRKVGFKDTQEPVTAAVFKDIIKITEEIPTYAIGCIKD